MKDSYEDIIDLPYSGSKRRNPMSMTNRGAQFSPFAALTGFDAAIRETERPTEHSIELDVDGKAILNEKLKILQQIQGENPQITLLYFIPDLRKEGGAYIRYTGNLKRVDLNLNAILFLDETVVFFDQIRDIFSDCLP